MDRPSRLYVRARTLLKPIITTLVAIVALANVRVRPASAHNTFVSSDPATGAELTAVPTQISFAFTKAVPLETASAQLIDAAGSRTQLTGLTHGPAGDTELVAPLPALTPGEVTVRWRLVGPDGHPLTDRVTFTVRAPATTTAAAAVPPASTLPAATTPTVTTSLPARDAADDEAQSVPGPLRWLLRAAAYLAILAMIGTVLCDGLVWPGALQEPRLRRVLRTATWTVTGTALAQLLVLAADIAGGVPGLGDVELAGRTSAGAALILRLLLVGVGALLLASPQHTHADVRWSVLSLTGIGLLGTWAFAGHGASQRWPHVGVSLDILHHLGAALWIGSLAVVGLVATERAETTDLARIFRRLSRWAATAVALLVATGLAQTVRLVGGVGAFVHTGHGRYLLLKLTILAAMLAIANANRRRVGTGLARTDTPRPAAVARLRRGIVTELALGLAIVGVTAAMVVSPPGAAG